MSAQGDPARGNATFGLLALLTLVPVAGAGIAMLETRFDPKALVHGTVADRQVRERFEKTFGAERTEVVFVLQAPNVLDDENLAALHALSTTLGGAPWVDSVDSLTATAMGSLATQADTAVTLDDLEAAASDPRAVAREQALEDALTAVVSSDPTGFPEGMVSLATRLNGHRFHFAPAAAPGPLTPAARKEARTRAEWPAVQGRLINDAGTAAVVVAHVRSAGAAGGESASSSARAGDQALLKRAEACRAATPTPSGTTLSVTGLPLIRATMERRLQQDQQLILGACCALSFLFLWIGFRRIDFAGIAMGAVGVSLLLVVGAMGWLGVPMTLLTNIVPPLLVTVGLGDAVHLLIRYQQEYRRAGPLALDRTLSSMRGACAVTSLTTAIGFGSLALSDTPALRQFGLVAVAGVAVAFLVTVAWLPTLLPKLPMHPETRAAKGLSRWLALIPRKATLAALRRPKTMVAAFLAATAVLGTFALFVRTDAALFDQLDAQDPALRAPKILETQFSGIRHFDVVLTTVDDAAATTPGALNAIFVTRLAALESWLRAQPLVRGTDSVTTLLDAAWAGLSGRTMGARGASAPWATDDRLAGLLGVLEGAATPDACTLCAWLGKKRAALRVRVRVTDAPAHALAALLHETETTMRTLGVSGYLVGETWESTRGLGRVALDLVASLPLCLALVFLAMTVLFRSLRLGLLAIPPNLLPLVMVLGYMALRDIPLHAGTLIVLPVSFGLVVDGTTHALAQFQARNTGPRALAITRALGDSGSALLVASGTLLVGFLALAFSGFRPIRLFAELSAVAIGTALLADLLLLPALLALLAPARPQRPDVGRHAGRTR